MDFIKTVFAASGAATLGTSLSALSENLPTEDTRMPVLFVGHGSPMNAIEDNEFSSTWKKLGNELPRPKAILCISAHWLTKGTWVTAAAQPKTIHDFGGFPRELFEVKYPAPGHPELAKEVAQTITSTPVGLDVEWGFDHGSWSVVRQMFPQADIPLLQLSIDYHRPAMWHYELGKQLATLRRKGVLIVGSGNMVHNLRLVDFSKINGGGYDWAIEMNETFKKHILNGNHQPLIDYHSMGRAAELAIPTPDHYFPMLYALALQEKNEIPHLFNDKVVGGSLNMTSVMLG